MAYAQSDAKLCPACYGLTFVMLRDGYTHPQSFPATVSSGRTCQLCRLNVCSMGESPASEGFYPRLPSTGITSPSQKGLLVWQCDYAIRTAGAPSIFYPALLTSHDFVFADMYE